MEIHDEDRAMAVQQDWRTAGLSQREQALCAYAERLTRTPGAMTAADLEPLRALGVPDEGILELCLVVAYFNYINRVADGLGVDLEDWMPPHPAGPPRVP